MDFQRQNQGWHVYKQRKPCPVYRRANGAWKAGKVHIFWPEAKRWQGEGCIIGVNSL